MQNLFYMDMKLDLSNKGKNVVWGYKIWGFCSREYSNCDATQWYGRVSVSPWR